jgi:myo-inositol 2-dehydrogenase/D-chiro-inositol 1-dehydrogenase
VSARLRVAIVGAGRMGRAHLAALSRCRRAVAVALVDPDAAARERAAGLAAHATVDDLLAAGGCDAAIVAAPTDLHVDLVRRFAAAGLPILCEKPCGLTAEDAGAAAQAAAGVTFQVGYWRRFVPELIALRDRVRSGALGTPSLLICHQWDELPPPPGFRARSGGIAVDMAVHEIDQARWLLGQEFGDVVAVGGAPGDDPDTAVATGRLSGGAVAALTLGRRFPAGDSCWCELFATGGYERVEFMTGASAQDAFTAALAAQADAFAAAVAGEAPRGAGGADAVAALRAAARIDRALDPVSAPAAPAGGAGPARSPAASPAPSPDRRSA